MKTSVKKNLKLNLVLVLVIVFRSKTLHCALDSLITSFEVFMELLSRNS